MKMALVILGAVLLLSMSTRNDSPAVTPEHTFESRMQPPASITATLRKSCYDCHSSETRWPWYSHIPPVSWMIHGDVREGRKSLNFSEWSTGAGLTPATSRGMLMAVCAAIKSDLMPKKQYLMLHPGAKLSETEKQNFCDWANKAAREK